MKYKPGIVMGGKYLTHDCGLSRSIGYFLEPLIVLGLFGKRPLSINLKGNAFVYSSCVFQFDFGCFMHLRVQIYVFFTFEISPFFS